MASAIQQTLRTLLAQNPRVLMFGQDIEDPKGGVFGVTRGLSSAYPGRVVNAPLAEATIVGTASGLSLAGYLPVFELQFIDFAGPAFNQIVNQIATVRWRSKGAWTNPLILLAPCGGYLPAGGPWHSQSNEGWFAHAPGLQVAIPSTPGDAAALLHAAAAGEDPVLFLIPKHLLRATSKVWDEQPIRLGQAAIRSVGTDVTLVAWGNCVPVSLVAAKALGQQGISAEVIDLRTLVPCDWETIQDSLAKTGRLIVIQEDNRTGSFGQSIISEVVSRAEMWRLLASRPELISRPDAHIGFHPALEAAVLPSCADIVAAAERSLFFPEQPDSRPRLRDWMFAPARAIRGTGGAHGSSGDEC
jgi:2-oxoisovalerate dehydrogenase E1 component